MCVRLQQVTKLNILRDLSLMHSRQAVLILK